jgi:hypothetical protein
MRKAILFSVICLLAPAIFAVTGKFTPLNVKPGLWQVIKTGTMPTTYKTCVTKKDLEENPFSGSEKCEWTIVSSTGTDMEARGTSCEMGREMGMKTVVDIKLHVQDSGNVKGTITGSMTGNGQNMSMNGDLTGKWISATCPANLD